MAKPIPAGYHTITSHLVVKNAVKAIDFYKKALGAKEIARMEMGPGKIGHAELQIGDSRLMLNDEFPDHGKLAPPAQGSGVTLHLYVPDVDAAFDRAIKAGATSTMKPADMFWGDRYGTFKDPFGHSWGIATHVEDVTPEECQKRLQSMMAAGKK
jgi:PhnB protein